MRLQRDNMTYLDASLMAMGFTAAMWVAHLIYRVREISKTVD
jgi:hypothetical protein